MTNHLAGSSSPYLLQHADNPVDWYPWGDEALAKARQEDKPIFLSIGYAACHWCHVMAHESFEDPETAQLMNAHFVNIKVDREERPDLDSIYMSYVVAISGQGGWPMSVFLTPQGKPFYGGTYFPPTRRHGMPAFREVLEAVARLWRNDRQQLLKDVDQVVHSLQPTPTEQAMAGEMDADLLQTAAHTLAQTYDWQEGGWGGAPKFPQPMLVEFLLCQASRGDQPALRMATHVLQMMARGGMYDVLGGGFARYSVDPAWLIPHFEKMLYDNAQLAQVYLHAHLLTGEPGLREVCQATLDFVLREMTHPEGGFYSSLDADSEGEEGKFYTWSVDEINSVFPSEQEADLFMAAYGITTQGNFEGANVLRRTLNDEELSQKLNLEVDSIPGMLADLRQRLLEVRNQRVRPATDNKVLVAWNALMLSAFADASRAFERSDYIRAAQRNADFMLENMLIGGKLKRSWREGKASHNAYLEDYAALGLGLISLYQADANPRWYQAAMQLAQDILDHFADPQVGFFDTRDDHEDLIYRPKDLQDNATPSGNALAAMLLLRLSAYEGRYDWRDEAEKMITANMAMMKRYPSAFGQWLNAADFAMGRVHEVAILGDMDDPAMHSLVQPVWKLYRPRLVLAVSAYPPPPGSPALLHDRPLMNGKPTAYVCQGFVCQQPVNHPQAMLDQLSASS